MSSAISVVQQADSFLPSTETLASLKAQAEAMVRSGILPAGIKSAEGLVTVMLTGRELGLPPMVSCQGLYAVKGRVGIMGNIALRLIYERAPQAEIIFAERSAKRSIIKVRRKPEHELQVFEFTIEEAKAARYNEAYDPEAKAWKEKPTWKADPASMLTWRNVARIGRLVFPDILGGVSYDRDELEDIEREEPRSDATQAAKQAAQAYQRKAQGQAEVIEGEVVEPKQDTPKASPYSRKAESVAPLVVDAPAKPEPSQKLKALLATIASTEKAEELEEMDLAGLVKGMEPSESQQVWDAYEARGEELGKTPDQEQQEEKPSAFAFGKKLEEAKTIDELQAVGSEVAKAGLTDDEKKALGEVFRARKKALTPNPRTAEALRLDLKQAKTKDQARNIYEAWKNLGPDTKEEGPGFSAFKATEKTLS